MSTLSTHVLDTVRGRPAANVALRLSNIAGDLLWAGQTNADGRYPGFPSMEPGRYRIEFEIGSYFRSLGVDLPEPTFLDVVVIDFGIADEGHHHIPLLVSPFAYSTYRGS